MSFFQISILNYFATLKGKIKGTRIFEIVRSRDPRLLRLVEDWIALLFQALGMEVPVRMRPRDLSPERVEDCHGRGGDLPPLVYHINTTVRYLFVNLCSSWTTLFIACRFTVGLILL